MADIFEVDILKFTFLNENFCILIRILLNLVPNDQINNKPAMVQTGNKSLSEPMIV